MLSGRGENDAWLLQGLCTGVVGTLSVGAMRKDCDVYESRFKDLRCHDMSRLASGIGGAIGHDVSTWTDETTVSPLALP